MTFKWKKTSILVLLLIGAMELFPFIPTQAACQDNCCSGTECCCSMSETETCEMSMTACKTVLFLPLIAAPLIKVEVTTQFLCGPTAPALDVPFFGQIQIPLCCAELILEAPPPGQSPLLI